MAISRSASLTGGGKIFGDLTIDGDLTVNGGDTNGAYDEIVNGELHVKITDTNAFLVEKADGTDVFTVDTTNSHVGIGSAIVSYTDAITTSQTLSIGENQDSSDKLASVQIIGRGSSSTDTLGALEFINTRSGSGVVSSIVGGRFNGGSASDGSLSFNTKNGSSLTTKMTINDVGNVGIGTAAPASMLNLKGDGTSIITLETSDTTQEVNNLTGAIYFRGNDATSGAGGTRAMIKANAQDSSGGHYMSFATAPSAGTVAERVRIDMDGNVGIGTSSPSALVHLTSSSADGNIIVESTHASSSAVVDIRSASDRDSSVLFREGTTVKARIKNDASADALVLTDGADTTTLTLAGSNATFAGDLIVGTHNSNSHRLEIESRHASVPFGQIVAGSADNNQAVGLQFTTRDSNGAENDTMFLTSTGLGIGTNAPASKLHVRETAGDEFFTFANGNGIGLVNNVASHGIGISASQSGSYGGQGSSALIVTEGGGSANAGTVQLVHDGTIGFTYKGGAVAIGTSPYPLGTNLEVYGGDSSTGIVRITGGEANNAVLQLYADQGDNSADKWQLISQASDNDFLIKANTTEVLRITDGSGNLVVLGGGTFGGDVTVSKSGNAFLNLTSTSGGARIKLTGQANETTNGLLFFEASNQRGSIVYNHATQSLTLNTGDSGTLALTLDSAQNATFAQKIGVGASPQSFPDKNVTIEGTSAGLVLRDSTGNNQATQWGTLFTSNEAVKMMYDDGGTFQVGNADDYQGTNYEANLILDVNSRISLSNNDSGTSNTVFGKLAGANIDAGSNYNTFIGENVADASLDDAIYNSAVGYSTLSALTSGEYNTAIGSRALLQVNSGSQNTALGYYSGYGITTGSNNVHIGALAGEGNTGASYLVGIGDDTFRVGGITTDANGAVAVGYQALRKLTSGGKNVAVGYLAGSQITTGDSNIALGHQAMDEISTGDRNIAIGHNAIGNAQGGATSGDSKDNIAIGFQSQGGAWADAECLKNTSIGSYSLDGALDGALQNTALGYASLGAVTQGDNNVAVGMEAGDNITTGTKNVTIGQQARTSAVGGTNQIVIGATVTGRGDNMAVIGNDSITDVYLSRDGGAKAHLESIQFPATQNASSNANCLDDYEEGDYDATVTCSTSGTITLEGAYNRLAYVKVGKSVTVTGVLIVNAVSSPSGFINISLPFAIGDGTDKSQSFSGAVHIHNANAILSRDFVNLGVEGESVLRVYVGDASGRQSDSAEGIIANTQLYIGITYQV